MTRGMIELLRIRRFRPGLTILLAVSMAFATGFPPAGASSLPRPDAGQRQGSYDGQTIFRGIFFASGPVANLFPEIWSDPRLTVHGQILTEEPSPFEDRVVARIDAADPAFFGRFAGELQSGDRLRIEAALMEGGKLLLNAFQSEPELQLPGSSITKTDEATVFTINRNIAYDRNVAIYRNVAYVRDVHTVLEAALAVVVVALLVIFIPPLATDPGDSTLKREMWIDWMAERLAPIQP